MRDVNGVVIGFVENTDDKDGLGRVKLSFPWLNQSYQTDWVQIAWPMSGGSRGFFFSPEKGDEVLVGFEHGNFDHPYVIGFLHNGKQKPPEKERKNRVILTPGGNTLRFEDKDNAKKVILKTSSGFVLEMDEESKKIILSDGDGESITILAQEGKIVINAPKIELVEGATHPVTFGDSLLDYLNNLNTDLIKHLHGGQLALGIFPVTPAPPTTPIRPASDTIYSKKVNTG